MKTNLKITLLGVLGLCMACTSGNKYTPDTTTVTSPKGTTLYQPDSASIARSYKTPDWFRDGKFGIFIHWGPASVPAYDGWYARGMYEKGSHVNQFHEKKYGPVTEFGYKEFIPMFKAEKFDPKAWAKLFKEAGATYVIPVAEHHDGFALYNSTFNKWNSVEMGPKRDLIKELRSAILEENLHFGLSSHRAEHCWFYNLGMKTPSDVQDTTISLYGERIEEPDGGTFDIAYDKHEGSNEHSRQNWLTHMYELIDQYEPELIYFDWTVGKKPFQDVFYKFLAYYYNNAVDWNKGVVVNTKFGYGDNIQVYDLERGKSDKIREYPWQTDTSIGEVFWFYMEDESDLKSADRLVDDLVDIVSKNGNLLLNVGPKADGTIPEKQQAVLREIGAWLNVNGEAIYGTRPWIISGEGDTKDATGHHSEMDAGYTSDDIRFTTKDETLYAVSLGWPDDALIIRSLTESNPQNLKVKSVSMLGSEGQLEWKQTDQGLVVKFPEQQPSDFAHVLKILFIQSAS